ncbi:MAG: GTPase [Candidatus Hodarchaeales archaeon]|jgi:nucleolar GTP-binding protein
MPSTNPFRAIKPIPFADELFTRSHNNVMKTSIRGTSTSSKAVPLIRKARKKEAARIELLSRELREKLFQIVEEFPTLQDGHIPDFYIEILDISFSIDKIRQTLGSLSGSADVIWKIKREYLGTVWHASSILATKDLRRAAFGRMESVIKKLKTRLEFLESVRKEMRLMPGIDFEQPTFCIAGYPNVGKSSLVNGVTSATPEIGAYPFTTKEATVGHLEIPVYASSSHTKPLTHIPCQIVDTPGILDRALDERNEIELRALAALKTLAAAIVFIFDFTQQEAINAQLNLYRQIISEFSEVPLLLLFGKADLLDQEEEDKLKVFIKENFPNDLFNLVTMNDPSSIHSLLADFFKTNQKQITTIMDQQNILVED